jgi:hypothetical protein
VDATPPGDFNEEFLADRPPGPADDRQLIEGEPGDKTPPRRPNEEFLSGGENRDRGVEDTGPSRRGDNKFLGDNGADDRRPLARPDERCLGRGNSEERNMPSDIRDDVRRVDKDNYTHFGIQVEEEERAEDRHWVPPSRSDPRPDDGRQRTPDETRRHRSVDTHHTHDEMSSSHATLVPQQRRKSLISVVNVSIHGESSASPAQLETGLAAVRERILRVETKLSGLKRLLTGQALRPPAPPDKVLVIHDDTPAPVPLSESSSDEEPDARDSGNIGITIPKYDEQLRIIREAVVELRSNVQYLRVRSERDPISLPVVIGDVKGGGQDPTKENPPAPSDVPSKEAKQIRALKTALESHIADADRTINRLRLEIYTFMDQHKQAPLVPVRDENPAPPVQVPTTPVAKPEHPKSGGLSGHPKNPSVPSIRNAPEPLPDSVDLDKKPARQTGTLILPDLLPLVTITKIPERPQKRPNSAEGKKRDPIVEPQLEGMPAQQTPPAVITPRASSARELPKKEKHGHIVPQPVPEIEVFNTAPERQGIIEYLVPQIEALNAALEYKIQQALDRSQHVEELVKQKVDKEFVNDFFRRIRLTVTELKQQIDGLKDQVPDRVTHEELRDMATELYASLSPDQPAAAGAVSYKCLFCGQVRGGVSGMITDSTVADSLGEPPKTRCGGKVGSTLVYGSDKRMYVGRGNMGRPTTAAAKPKIPPLRPETATDVS